jgi:RIO-like serine/threonine protein kinase
VPTSCQVSRDITETTTEPIMGHFSDVYSGMLNGRRVAIKVLRVHRDQREKVKKVCQRMRSPTTCSYLGCDRRIFMNWWSGSACGLPT